MSSDLAQARWWQQPWLAPVLAIVTHIAGVTGRFVMDDLTDIVHHPVVGGSKPWWNILQYNFMGQPITKGANTIRPLTTLNFTVEWSLWGNNPLLFHLTSLLLFVALVWVGQRLLSRWLSPALTVLAACLFASLAIHVEVVAAIANRAEVWSLLFALLALQAALHNKTLLAAVLYFGSLLGKESSFLLPVLVFWVFLVTEGWEKLKENRRLQMIGVLVGTSVLFLALRAYLMPLKVSGRIVAADNPILLQGMATRIWMTFVLLGKYLWLTLFPTSLSADYTFAAIPVGLDLTVLYGWLGVLFAFGNIALGWKLWSRRHEDNTGLSHAVLLSIGGFVVSYALFSNSVFLIVTIFAERLFLAPSFWFCLWLVSIVALVLRNRPALASMSTVLTGVLVVFVAWQVFWGVKRSREWKDQVTLFQALVKTQPASIKGRLYLSRELANSKQYEEALWHLAVGIQGRTRFPKSWKFDGRLDALPLKQRIQKIPGLLAPKLPPAIVLQQFSRMARTLLGPSTLPVIGKWLKKYPRPRIPKPRRPLRKAPSPRR